MGGRELLMLDAATFFSPKLNITKMQGERHKIRSFHNSTENLKMQELLMFEYE
jgi:hypothetical protein